MTPQFVYYVIPIAALLSVLVTFGVLSQSSELTVMKACGVSLYRAAVSVVLLSLVFSGILFGLEQKVLAKANRRADVLDAQIRGRAPRLFDIMNRQWVVGHDGSIYHYSYYNPERDEMTGLVIYRPDQRTWTLSSATFAERVSWNARLAGVVRMGTGLQVEPARHGRLSRSGRSKGWRRPTTSRPSSRWPT